MIWLGAHLVGSAAVAALFAWQFGQNPRVVIAHVLLVAEWDLVLLGLQATLLSFASPATAWPKHLFRACLALTVTAQILLYALDAVSQVSWNQNMTARVVLAFAPTVWSGKEPFPVGAFGMSAFVAGVLAVAVISTWRLGGALHGSPAVMRPLKRSGAVALTIVMVGVVGATTVLAVGRAGRDSPYFKQELVASFFRQDGFALDPTARRLAVADRDAAIRAAYPSKAGGAHVKNVVLVIVDSLRADRMQVYGYARPTTPFLSGLVDSGRMKRVASAFSTCSESFCGIASTLASREFRDLSARTFQLQDVLRGAGYQTWFLLSGNHRVWNGLPQFYRAEPGTLFDGGDTKRYTVDDDRIVLEGLERVPTASAGHPAFFYVHLMSPHYLGVQFPESHFFTSPRDTLDAGSDPYKMVDRLNQPDRYDDKIRQADGVIHDLFDALRVKGYLDDSIVVVTGDHGEGLGERHWAHGWHLYNEDIRIPLLIYDTPPAAAYPDLTFGAQVDIAPTVLSRVGLPIPSSWEGQPLTAPRESRFTYHQTYFLPNRFAVIYRDHEALFKFIATPAYGKEELYDLRRDPGEATNLVTERPEMAAVLREKIRAYRTDE